MLVRPSLVLMAPSVGLPQVPAQRVSVTALPTWLLWSLTLAGLCSLAALLAHSVRNLVREW